MAFKDAENEVSGLVQINFFNQERTNEIRNKCVHLNDHNMNLE